MHQCWNCNGQIRVNVEESYVVLIKNSDLPQQGLNLMRDVGYQSWGGMGTITIAFQAPDVNWRAGVASMTGETPGIS